MAVRLQGGPPRPTSETENTLTTSRRADEPTGRVRGGQRGANSPLPAGTSARAPRRGRQSHRHSCVHPGVHVRPRVADSSAPSPSAVALFAVPRIRNRRAREGCHPAICGKENSQLRPCPCALDHQDQLQLVTMWSIRNRIIFVPDPVSVCVFELHCICNSQHGTVHVRCVLLELLSTDVFCMSMIVRYKLGTRTVFV